MKRWLQLSFRWNQTGSINNGYNLSLCSIRSNDEWEIGLRSHYFNDQLSFGTVNRAAHTIRHRPGEYISNEGGERTNLGPRIGSTR